jgi:hypothetical protein
VHSWTECRINGHCPESHGGSDQLLQTKCLLFSRALDQR